MYGPHVAILLMCVSRNTRHIDFRRLTGSQRTPGKWGVTESSPLRAIPLLSISSPCRGILFYRYRERARRRLVLEAEI